MVELHVNVCLKYYIYFKSCTLNVDDVLKIISVDAGTYFIYRAQLIRSWISLLHRQDWML